MKKDEQKTEEQIIATLQRLLGTEKALNLIETVQALKPRQVMRLRKLVRVAMRERSN